LWEPWVSFASRVSATAVLAGLYGSDVAGVPIAEISARIEQQRAAIKKHELYWAQNQAAGCASGALSAFPSRLRSTRLSLVAFEAWNLLVIFAALVGFNHVPTLAAYPWTLRALWPVAVGTVAVTGYCVFVWTRE
jgi:hypothetical protein